MDLQISRPSLAAGVTSASRHALLVLPLLLAGCQWETFGGSDTRHPKVEMKDYAQEKIDQGPRKGRIWGSEQRDPSAEPVAALCRDIRVAGVADGRSVACFPLVSEDLRTSAPWVSELGVAIADDVAWELERAGGTTALGTNDVALRLSEANVSRSALTTLETIAGAAGRLRADVVVGGSIRRRDRVGALDRDVLSCELRAYDVASGKVIATSRWDIPSDDASLRETWDLAQAESPWLAESRWQPRVPVPSLLSELDFVAAHLADSLATQVPASGTVYVAPLDTAAFVKALAQLNGARAAFAAEYGRRFEAAKSAVVPLDTSRPITIDGTEFADLQKAEDYLARLSTALQTTSAARFGQAFSGLLADQLQQRLPTGATFHAAPLRDETAAQLVGGELASGGLSASKAARQALADAGVTLVVAPRLEQIAGIYQIRAEVIAPGTGAIAGTALATVLPELGAQVEAQLGADAVLPAPTTGSVVEPTKSWDAIYSDSRSGVVQVFGPEGRGTGFVVSGDGLVLTNDHVLRGIGTPITVQSEGGAQLAGTAVLQDSFLDLAAIRVKGLAKSTHVFAFAPGVAVGNEVAVLGHPKESSGWVLTPGYVSSISELCPTADGRERPSLMYTCPTRQGSSGSPVLLRDGRVAAVHFGGHVGQSISGASPNVTELTGFALGVPAEKASAFVAQAEKKP